MKQEQQDKIKESIRVQVEKDKIKMKDMEERETTLRMEREHLEQERTDFEKDTVAAEQKHQLLEQQYLKKWAALEKLQQKTQVLQTKGKNSIWKVLEVVCILLASLLLASFCLHRSTCIVLLASF